MIEMPIIGLQGLRGGTGTTSITAGLAWALQELGESVLVLDFSPTNLLRLHFNMPFVNKRGWMRAYCDGTPWQEAAMRYTPLLDFIPFGVLDEAEYTKTNTQLEQDESFWYSNIKALYATNAYKWILLDIPERAPLSPSYRLEAMHHLFLILNPDMNCHTRIHQQKIPDHCLFLLNKYSSNSTLQRDLLELWKKSLPNLLPQLIHVDESLAEAFAAKQPLGEYAPKHLSTQELTTIANWCLLHLSEQKK
jgi:cellulose synthase operon protein YhjQ